MIKKLSIKNFKSIKKLEFDCSRVNVFIGEPNTGKSNILESVGILSFGYTGRLSDFVRYERISNLFYNNLIGNEIIMNYDIDKDSTIHEWENSIDITFKHSLSVKYTDKNQFEVNSKGDFHLCEFSSTYGQNSGFMGSVSGPQPFVRFFRLKNVTFEKADEVYSLKPPEGRNLMNVVLTNEIVREFVSDLIKTQGFKLRLSEETGKVSLEREIKNIYIDYPFSLLSDTYINLIIYYAAIESSRKHTIVLEEPEAHVFPFYNKFLSERIALFNTNQFFIGTHNPTFLINLIENTPDEDLRVFITYYDKRNFETKVVPLIGKECDKLLAYGGSLFLNLNKFYNEE